jgi:hypothetical protein
MIDRTKIYKDILAATQEAFTRRDTVNNMVNRIVIAATNSILDAVEKEYGNEKDEGSDQGSISEQAASQGSEGHGKRGRGRPTGSGK